MPRYCYFFFLIPIFLFAQSQKKDKKWYQKTFIKVGYADNFRFTPDLVTPGVEIYVPNNATFRLGLGYDVDLNEKWTISPTIELDWIRSIYEERINPASGFNINSFSRNSSGSELDLIVSSAFQYKFYQKNNKSLGLVLSPQINFRSYNDVGLGGFGTGDGTRSIRYEYTERNRILRPSLLAGLNYNFHLGRLPVRTQAFFSYSFTPQYFGEYTFTNEFNSTIVTNDYEFDGHQAGVSVSLFPFGNGDKEKKQKKEIKSRESNYGYSRFGFKAGVNFTDISATDSDNFGPSGYVGTEVYGGLFIDTKISKNWNLQNEAIFSWSDQNLFLEIPVLFKRNLGSDFWAFAGPKAQIVTNESMDIERNFGAGLDFGLQYNLPKDFIIEARYGLGLSRQVADEVLSYEGGKRNVFRIGVGFKF